MRFSLLSALTGNNDPPHKAAKPFSLDRDGFVMAEGAGAMVWSHWPQRWGERLGFSPSCKVAGKGR